MFEKEAQSIDNKEESLEQILNNIKHNITHEVPNYDVLVLTDKVKNDINNNDTANDNSNRKDDLNNDNLNLNTLDYNNSPLNSDTTFGNLSDNKILSNTKNSSNEKILTVEELMAKLLKPELKKQLKLWLNQNLPGLVAEIIEKEIKKLIPKN